MALPLGVVRDLRLLLKQLDKKVKQLDAHLQSVLESIS